MKICRFNEFLDVSNYIGRHYWLHRLFFCTIVIIELNIIMMCNDRLNYLISHGGDANWTSAISYSNYNLPILNDEEITKSKSTHILQNGNYEDFMK